VLNDTIFDTTVSRTADGSGSWQLTTPFPNSRYSRVISKFITFPRSGTYYLSFFVRSGQSPSAVAYNLRKFGPEFNSLGNSNFGFFSPSTGNQWQEVVVPIEVDVAVSPIVQLHFFKVGNSNVPGTIWVDDIHFGLDGESSQVASQKHLRRESENLFPSASDERLQFIPISLTEYDETISRSVDGSGSWKLTKQFSNTEPYSVIISSFLKVPESGDYTFSFYMRTEAFPSYVGYNLRLWDKDFRGIANSDFGFAGTTGTGEWQEVVVPVTLDASFSPNIQVRLFHRVNADGGKGSIWVDDFYFGKGTPTFEQPPPEERVPFEGSRTRIDELGNFEVLQSGVWEPFFPWAMHTNTTRDDWTEFC
jgi:hypothetical protein